MLAAHLAELSMAIHRRVRHRTRKENKHSFQINSAETGILMTQGVAMLLIDF